MRKHWDTFSARNTYKNSVEGYILNAIVLSPLKINYVSGKQFFSILQKFPRKPDISRLFFFVVEWLGFDYFIWLVGFFSSFPFFHLASKFIRLVDWLGIKISLNVPVEILIFFFLHLHSTI